MKKRLLSLALVAAMMCSLFAAIPVSAASMFSDVDGHWAQDTIEELANKGIVNGKGDGTYDPEGKVTRAEFIKLLMCIEQSEFESVEGQLEDVPEDAWYNPYVYAAFDRGIFYLNELDNNQFLPNGQADRETVAVWSVRLLGIESDSTDLPFADSDLVTNKEAVATAYNYGIITGDAGTLTFRPNDPLTRAEAAAIIKRVMTQYQEIYYVRPAKNIVDYVDGLTEVTATEEYNILSEADADAGKFVFTNINDEIRNLQVGDLFIIKPCDAIPSGIAIKVKEITISGNTATIMQGDIALEDVVEEIDVAEQIELTMDNLIPGSLGEGVTIEYNGNDVTEDYLADASGDLLALSGDANVPMDIDFNIKYKWNEHLNITGKISLSDIVLSADIQFSGAKLKKLKLTETHTTEMELKLTGVAEYDALSKEGFIGDKRYKKGTINEGQYTADYKYERENLKKEIFNLWKDKGYSDFKTEEGKNATSESVKLASFNIPLGTTGIYVVIDFRFTLKGTIEATATFSFSSTKTSGISYTDSDGLSKVNTRKDTESDLVVAGTGEIKGGAEGSIGLTFLYLLTVDLGAEFGMGAKVSTELLDIELADVNEIVYDDITGKIPQLTETIIKNQVDDNEDEIHTCDICCDGRLYLYLTVEVKCEVGAGWLKATLFNPKWEILNDDNARLLSAYLSVNLDRDPVLELGWGTCPYKLTAPKIYSQSDDKKYQLGDTITLAVNDTAEADWVVEKVNTFVANSWLNRYESEQVYQWYKDGVPISGATQNIYQKASFEEADAGVYNCILALKDDISLYTVSKDINVEYDTNILDGGSTSSETATSHKYTGRVSEENQKYTFNYTAPISGIYRFNNTGGKTVFISVDGTYKINEGSFTLVGGKTYTVSVEWYLEDTDFAIAVFAPTASQDISGNIEVSGRFTYENQIITYTYVPQISAQYTFEAGDGISIIIMDKSGTVYGEGNPSASAYMTEGETYTIALSYAYGASKDFTMNISAVNFSTGGGNAGGGGGGRAF